MFANGHDAEIFQNKDANSQRWHLYERMNDLFILIHSEKEEAAKRLIGCDKRFKRIEKIGIYSMGAVLVCIGILFGAGIITWEEIKPVLAIASKIP